MTRKRGQLVHLSDNDEILGYIGPLNDATNVYCADGRTVEEVLSEMKEKVDNASEGSSSASSTVENIKTDLTGLEGRVTKNEEDIADLKAAKDELVLKTNNIQENVTNLGDSITETNNNITNLGDQITEIKNTNTTIQQTIQENIANITNIMNEEEQGFERFNKDDSGTFLKVEYTDPDTGLLTKETVLSNKNATTGNYQLLTITNYKYEDGSSQIDSIKKLSLSYDQDGDVIKVVKIS